MAVAPPRTCQGGRVKACGRGRRVRRSPRLTERERFGAPPGAGGDAGLQQLQALEEAGDLLGGARGVGHGAAVRVEAADRLDVVGVGGAAVVERQIAARRQRVEQAYGHRTGLVVVADQAEDSHQHQADGAAQVEGVGAGGQDRVRVADVGVEVAGGALRGAGQQRLCVGEHQRVVVDVDDPGLGGHPLGDLVGVVDGRQAGADVQVLPDARLVAEVPYDAAGEGAGVAGDVDHAGEYLAHLVAGRAVDGVVVLAAQEVVPDTRGVRDRGVDLNLTALRAFGHGGLPLSTAAVRTCTWRPT